MRVCVQLHFLRTQSIPPPCHGAPAAQQRGVQERMKQAQRIALQAASRVMSAARVTENVGSGIRRVVPSGSASATAADTQAALVLAAQSAASKIAGSQGMLLTRGDAIKAAAAAQSAAAKQVATAQPYFEADLVINDFPQAARYHVTHRDTIAHIAERTGVTLLAMRAACFACCPVLWHHFGTSSQSPMGIETG